MFSHLPSSRRNFLQRAELHMYLTSFPAFPPISARRAPKIRDQLSRVSHDLRVSLALLFIAKTGDHSQSTSPSMRCYSLFKKLNLSFQVNLPLLTQDGHQRGGLSGRDLIHQGDDVIQHCVLTVSYTHLTLPTKLEV